MSLPWQRPVLVAIPYYGCADYIARCVRSVLRQSYKNLVCLVVGDGDDPIEHLGAFEDSRLVVHAFPRNRGAPFVQQAMLLANPHEWYAPVGADDWLDRDHLATLLRYKRNAVTVGAVFWHRPGRKTVPIREVDYEVGVYRTQALIGIGGYCADERMSQDSLLVELAHRTLDAPRSMHPTYHRLKRPSAMTTDPATDFDSEPRQQALARNAAVLAEVELIGSRQHAAIRAYRDGLLKPATRRALAAATDELREVLAESYAPSLRVPSFVLAS